MKNIFIRTDSSYEIGMGHVFRCLTLAYYLKKDGFKVIFICRNLKGNLISHIKKNFNVIVLKDRKSKAYLKNYEKWLTVKQEDDAYDTVQALNFFSVHCLIIDSYALDKKWESKLNKYVRKILVIDDLANRKHQCDFLIDTNYYINYKNRYNKLINSKTYKFLGPKYSFIRNDFVKLKESQKKSSKDIKEICIFIGGNDSEKKIIFLLKQIDKNFLSHNFHLIIGPLTKNIKEIKKNIKKNSSIKIYLNKKDIAPILNMSEICIVTGGTIVTELLFLQKPTLVLIVAKKQKKIAIDLTKRKLINSITYDKVIINNVFEKNLNNIILNYESIKKNLIKNTYIYKKNYLRNIASFIK